MKRVKPGCVLAIAFVLGAGVAVYFGLRSIPVSFGYSARAQFQVMPESDRELEAWMAEQPGVAKVAIMREKSDLIVNFIMVQSAGPREPRIPDLEAAFKRLGYRDQVSFRWE